MLITSINIAKLIMFISTAYKPKSSSEVYVLQTAIIIIMKIAMLLVKIPEIYILYHPRKSVRI